MTWSKWKVSLTAAGGLELDGSEGPFPFKPFIQWQLSTNDMELREMVSLVDTLIKLNFINSRIVIAETY